MGYMVHKAIIVTSALGDKLAQAHSLAISTGLITSQIIPSPVNCYATFMVVPDGSKTGWAERELADAARDEFLRELGQFNYEDKSSPFNIVEVQYGGDDEDETPTCITRFK